MLPRSVGCVATSSTLKTIDIDIIYPRTNCTRKQLLTPGSSFAAVSLELEAPRHRQGGGGVKGVRERIISVPKL
jgi:hypothetical protein